MPATSPRPAAPAASEEADVEIVRSSLFYALQPPVDEGKVAAIRQAIAQGLYRVSPAAIADALIEAASISRNEP